MRARRVVEGCTRVNAMESALRPIRSARDRPLRIDAQRIGDWPLSARNPVVDGRIQQDGLAGFSLHHQRR